MKQLSKIGVRIFISIIASAVIAETLNIIAGKPSPTTETQNNTIGMLSGIILFAVITFFVRKYKNNNH
jgi:LPXTG-motif cell wall-anchored protein